MQTVDTHLVLVNLAKTERQTFECNKYHCDDYWHAPNLVRQNRMDNAVKYYYILVTNDMSKIRADNILP